MVAVFLTLAACSRTAPAADSAPAAVAPAPSLTADTHDEDRQPADGSTDTSYEDIHGTDDCTEDCSGHDAGYAWARDNDITDPDDCSGNSESFIEGCRAYAEDQE